MGARRRSGNSKAGNHPSMDSMTMRRKRHDVGRQLLAVQRQQGEIDLHGQ